MLLKSTESIRGIFKDVRSVLHTLILGHFRSLRLEELTLQTELQIFMSNVFEHTY